MSTGWDRIPSRHRGQRSDQLRTVVGMRLYSAARLRPALSLVCLLGIDDEDSDRQVIAGLGEIDHGGCEGVGSGVLVDNDVAVAGDLRRRTTS